MHVVCAYRIALAAQERWASSLTWRERHDQSFEFLRVVSSALSVSHRQLVCHVRQLSVCRSVVLIEHGQQGEVNCGTDRLRWTALGSSLRADPQLASSQGRAGAQVQESVGECEVLRAREMGEERKRAQGVIGFHCADGGGSC